MASQLWPLVANEFHKQPVYRRWGQGEVYGKVFDSIYDGTLYGHWEAIVTMQQFIVLANADGVVDMTPQAIAARTSIPLHILLTGIKVLEEPDPYTRTPGEEGRRIILIDSHRPWGWKLVNHGKYMRLRNMAEKHEADRLRIAEKRKQNKDVAIESRDVANVAHEDVEEDKNKDKKGGRAVALPDWLPKEAWEAWLEVRQRNRAPNTARALRLAITELAKLKAAGQDVQAVLEQSTLRGWRGIFSVKVDSSEPSRPKERICSYCWAKSAGNVNGYEFCREHEHMAMDHERPRRVAVA